MKPADAHADLKWPASPPSPERASRITAWVSVAMAVVFGLLLTGMLYSGTAFYNWRMVFTGAIVLHLLMQAGTSAFSWKAGALCGRISLALIFLVACAWIVFYQHWNWLSWLTGSAIVSATAVTIAARQKRSKNDDA